MERALTYLRTMPMLLAAALAVQAPAVSAPVSQPQGETAGRCSDVAQALRPVLAEVLDSSVALSETAPEIQAMRLDDLTPEQRRIFKDVDIPWSGHWEGQQPSAALKAAWSGNVVRTAAPCLRNITRELRVTIARETPGGGAMARISEPMFDASGNQALVLVQTVGKGYGDFTGLRLLMRSGGRWKVIGKHEIIVS